MATLPSDPTLPLAAARTVTSLSGQPSGTGISDGKASASSPVAASWHRIRTVRLQQGMSLRSVARRTGLSVRVLRQQEQETTDLRLSELYRWQKALEVPVGELLVENELPLSRPVLERARLVRIMKTALSLKEQANTPPLRCLAERLVGQLIELMPELAHVSAWPSLGQRRTLDELGRVAENPVSEEWLRNAARDDER
ncbi:MAG: hypothetical protein KatS3mg110_2105 [Pirellulaceae bacterium]|nr:MAG: hypothetical protein KatS3mg110_2105 [Pirellulaceae bacterium]